MFVRATILGLATFFAATTAQAASDLRVAIADSGPAFVYDDFKYAISVSNVGNSRATGVALTVQLPFYESESGSRILADLGDIDPRCRVNLTQLSCRIGPMSAGQVSTIGFEVALPQVDGSIGITASVSATSRETHLGNNVMTRQAVLRDYAVDLGDAALVQVDQCMGDEPGSYFECVDDNGTRTEFDVGFLDTGKISLPQRPEYYGEWSQVPFGKTETDPHYLRFYIVDEDGFEVSFEGYGSSDSCFEGLASFDEGESVAAYRVCV
jgi:hypothetical protein